MLTKIKLYLQIATVIALIATGITIYILSKKIDNLNQLLGQCETINISIALQLEQCETVNNENTITCQKLIEDANVEAQNAITRLTNQLAGKDAACQALIKELSKPEDKDDTKEINTTAEHFNNLFILHQSNTPNSNN